MADLRTGLIAGASVGMLLGFGGSELKQEFTTVSELEPVAIEAVEAHTEARATGIIQRTVIKGVDVVQLCQKETVINSGKDTIKQYPTPELKPEIEFKGGETLEFSAFVDGEEKARVQCIVPQPPVGKIVRVHLYSTMVNDLPIINDTAKTVPVEEDKPVEEGEVTDVQN